MKTPTSWKHAPVGAKVWVKWPHPEAMVKPELAGKTVNREATVESAKKGAVMVRLATGGAIEVRNLGALLIEDEQDKKDANAWWRTESAA